MYKPGAREIKSAVAGESTRLSRALPGCPTRIQKQKYKKNRNLAPHVPVFINTMCRF